MCRFHLHFLFFFICVTVETLKWFLIYSRQWWYIRCVRKLNHLRNIQVKFSIRNESVISVTFNFFQQVLINWKYQIRAFNYDFTKSEWMCQWGAKLAFSRHLINENPVCNVIKKFFNWIIDNKNHRRFFFFL